MMFLQRHGHLSPERGRGRQTRLLRHGRRGCTPERKHINDGMHCADENDGGVHSSHPSVSSVSLSKTALRRDWQSEKRR